MTMKHYVLITLLAFSSISYASYNKGCLRDCFGTGHDCAYCAYQCENTSHLRWDPNYDGDVICPLNPSVDYGYNDN